MFGRTVNGRVILTTIEINGNHQIIWVFSRTFSIITAFHYIPLVIYPFYIVLNAFNCITVVLVHIAGIIAHYRELLGLFGCVLYFLNILLVDITGITVLYRDLLSHFWLWFVLFCP